MTAKHSPFPWSSELKRPGGEVTLYDGEGRWAGNTVGEFKREHAALIVRCVNAHAELVESAKEMLALMDNLWESVDWGSTHNLDIARLNLAPERLRAALRKAEGK